jgi:predicted deacylase
MVALGMVDGALPASSPQLHVSDLSMLIAPRAGILEPHVPISALGSEIAPRAALGAIVDLHVTEPVTFLEAGYDRAILLMAPEYDTKVEPGDLAFIVADASTAVPVQTRDHSQQEGDWHEHVQVSPA